VTKVFCFFFSKKKIFFASFCEQKEAKKL